MKYVSIVVVFLLCILAHQAPADSVFKTARDKMLKCSYEVVKSEAVIRAKDKIHDRKDKRENIEDKLLRDNLDCAIEVFDSVFTYKGLFE